MGKCCKWSEAVGLWDDNLTQLALLAHLSITLDSCCQSQPWQLSITLDSCQSLVTAAVNHSLDNCQSQHWQLSITCDSCCQSQPWQLSITTLTAVNHLWQLLSITALTAVNHNNDSCQSLVTAVNQTWINEPMPETPNLCKTPPPSR